MQSALEAVNWRRILIALGAVAIAVVAIVFLRHIPRTLAIFIVAAFIASAAQPVVVHLERGGIPRVWSIAIVYVVLIVLLIVGGVIILPLVFAQIQALAGGVPGYLASAQGALERLQAQVHAHFPSATIPVQFANLQKLGAQRLDAIVTLAVASVGSFALSLATGLFVAIAALVLSFFFLVQHRQIADGFASLFPADRQETARQLATEIVGVFGGFIAGQVIVSAATGAAIALLCALFHFKFALLLGLISAVCYAIPILGMLIAHAFGLITAAPQGWGMVITVQIIVFTVARVSDNVLVPKIMGETVGVSPIGVMFAVFAGGELFGIPGLILGIPAAALIKLIWRYFIAPMLHGNVIIVDAAAVPIAMPAPPPRQIDAP